MTPKTIYILFHGRFPSEKAAALFASMSAASFVPFAKVVLLVPRRLKRDKPAALPEGVRAVYLPTLDFFQVPIFERIAFAISNVVFSLSCLVYLFVNLKDSDIVDTNESLPAFFVSFLTRNIVFEVHDFPERFHSFYSKLFTRVRVVLATNMWKKKALQEKFNLSEEKVVLERNGVDIERFASGSKEEARTKLSLSQEASIAVYTGHLYGWKGVDTFGEAALLLPDTQFYIVGGNPQDIVRFKENHSASNIHLVGFKPHEEIPLWQAAADALVLPNTGAEKISANYTSPMKLFEYMASGRPIVASNIPSIAEVLTDQNAYLVTPDDSRALADALTKVFSNREEAKQKAQQARIDVTQFSWEGRAKRFFRHLTDSLKERVWFRSFVILLAYLFLLGAVFYPFLFSGYIFTGGDVTVYYYAAFDFYHKALLSGQSFLWNPLLFSGFPMYLSQVAGYFDPVNYAIFHFFGGYEGVNLRLFLDYLLVCVTSYAAARAWGLSRIASFCVGPAYILPFIGTITTNPLFANSAFLMPLLMWIFAKIRQSGGFNWKLSLLGGVAVGWAFLGGYAQSVVMYLTLFGVFGLIYIFLVLEEGKVRFLLRFAGLSLIIGGLGLLVGALQILPTLEFTSLTRRGGGVDYSLASLKAVLPGDIILFLFPDYTYFPYVSVGRRALYVGATWSLLALGYLRIVGESLWKRSRSMREPLVFALVFLIALITAVTHSPIFYVLQHLPVFKLFRFSDRWLYGGIFFLAMFGGYGLDALPSVREKYLKRWYALLSIPIGLFLAFICFLNLLTASAREAVASFCMKVFSHTVYGHGPFIKDISHYHDATLRGVEAWQKFTSLSDLSFLWPTAILFAGLIYIWMLLYKKISIHTFRLGVLLISVVTFISLVSFPFRDTLSQAEIRNLNRNSFMQFVSEEDKKLYRYYPVFLADAYQKVVPPTYQLTHEQIKASVQMAFATGWPNTNFAYNMPSVDGYDVFITNSYIDVLAKAGGTFGAQDYTRPVPLDEKIQRLNTYVGVIGMMGGKYIVSGVELNNAHLTLAGKYVTSDLQILTYVYINDSALPVAYIAQKTTEAPGRTLSNLMDDGKIDFTHTTYLDCSSCSRVGDASLSSYVLTNGRVEVQVTAREVSWLVLSQSNLPGWAATIDGTVANIVTVNGLYMGVEVPVGEHLVEFVYTGMPLK